MKQLLLFLLFIPVISYSQDCNSPSINPSDITKLQDFLKASPINFPLDEGFFNYKKGLSNYYPSGTSIPWAGYFMPQQSGGIATRWRINDSAYPKVPLYPILETIKTMKQDDIDNLSPAEKMDIFLGDDTSYITNWEVTHRGPLKLGVSDWEGFCNGMRAAGALVPEPLHPIEVKSLSTKGNFWVKFYPADLKALLAMSYFYVRYYASIGTNNKCVPNPGLFDVFLRGILAQQKASFFIDVNPGDQKWNETIIGYERVINNETIVNQSSTTFPSHTKKIISITTNLSFLAEVDINQSNGITTDKISNHQLIEKGTAKYQLYVDENDKIIGGKWQSFQKEGRPKYNNPDYVWFAAGDGTDWLTNNSFLKFNELTYLVMLARR